MSYSGRGTGKSHVAADKAAWWPSAPRTAFGLAGTSGAAGGESLPGSAPSSHAGPRRAAVSLFAVLLTVVASVALAVTLFAPRGLPAGAPAHARAVAAPSQQGWATVGERAAVSRSLGASAPSYWAGQRSVDVVALRNPVQGLSATFTATRVALSGGHGLRFGLSALAIGRAGSLAPAVLGSPQVSHNRIAYASPSISEWFVNGPLGVEQGFTVAHRPAGSAPLVISQQFAGNLAGRVSAGGHDATFSSRAGMLRYNNLLVTDALGTRVPARLSVVGRRLNITINDARAVYPLHIDPVIVTPVTQSPTSNADTGLFPYSAAFSPSGTLLAAANYTSKTISVFTVDPSTGLLTPVTQSTPSNADTPSGAYSLAFDPNGALLATANYNSGTVSIFSIHSSTGQLAPVTQTIANNANTASGPVSIAFSPNGKLLATANVDTATVSVFSVDPSTGQLTPVTQSTAANADTGSSPLSVSFSPNGKLLATANYGSGTVSLFSVDPSSGQLTPVTPTPTSSVDTGLEPSAVTFSPNGSLLAAASSGSDVVSVFSVEAATGQVTPVTQTPASDANTGSYPFSVAFSPNGGLLATANFLSGSVSLFGVDPASGALTPLPQSPATNLDSGPIPSSVAFSPDGGLIATANRNGATLSLFAIDGSAAKVSLALSVPSITADGVSTTVATATVTDAHGNPVSGDPVTITSGGSQNITAVTPGITLGTYQATITSTTVAGTASIRATDTADSGVSDSQTLTQTAGAAANVALALAPASITADGSSTTVATATVTDAHGNPVSGETVTIKSTGAQKIGPVTAGTIPGTYKAAITSSTGAGTATISASDTSVAKVSAGQTLTQTAGPATTVTLALSPSSIIADGRSTSVATATVTDAHGNPVSGDAVKVTASLGESVGAVTAAAAPGTYQATITSTTAVGQATITATDSSVTGVSTTQMLTQVAPVKSAPPPATFSIAGHRRLANGTIVLTLSLSGSGEVQAVGTHGTASGSSFQTNLSLITGKHHLAWGPVTATRAAGGKLRIKLRPNKAARVLLRNAHRIGSSLRVRVTVMFTPSNGAAQIKAITVRLLKAHKH
jgi:6-phosphogluconolactonase